MSVYVVGDVQGCYEALRRLLDRVDFDAARDRLWLVGDLVNRGPDSVSVLRFVRGLGDAAIAILGNHDLHLLAVRAGARREKRSDTFDDVLSAPDADELLTWLRERPVLHYDARYEITMVHAGLPPQWTVAEAKARAAELEAALRGPSAERFFHHMYGAEPTLWSPELRGWERLRYITNALTRLRYCDRDGALALDPTGPPFTVGPEHLPWFAFPGRASEGERIVFGHWATLEMDELPTRPRGVFHLDSGCVWGGRLTALRLEDERLFSVPCARSANRAYVP